MNGLNKIATQFREEASDLLRIKKIIDETKRSAFNKAVKSGYSRMEGVVRQKYALKKKDINEDVKIVKATKIDSPVAKIEIKSKGISLLMFKARQVGKWKSGKHTRKINPSAGTKATIIVGNRQLFKQAFVTSIKYGENVFMRSDSSRGSVFPLYGIQSSTLFSSDKATNVLTKETTEQLANMFVRDVNYKLG
jgi:hypothetical protein